MTKGLHKDSLRKVDNPHQWMIDDARMELIQQIKAEVERLKGICTAQIKVNPGQTFPFVMEMTGYDKLLSFLSDLEKSLPTQDAGGSSEIPKDLEEAADEYFKNPENSWVVKDIFIAGAKWQKEQMMDEWLKDRDGCFWDGVEEGKKAMREQMMKEAVEGRIDYVYDEKGDAYKAIRLDWIVGDFGDKVKLIIVKED